MIADTLVLNALAKIQHDKDFARVVLYLTACRDEQVANCMKERDEVLLRRAQGAARELGEFVLLCGQARGILEERQHALDNMPVSESYT